MSGLGKPDGEGNLALLKKGSEGKREILENFGCKVLEYNGWKKINKKNSLFICGIRKKVYLCKVLSMPEKGVFWHILLL